MKFKKVSEHPLPKGDWEKQYILKFDKNNGEIPTYHMCWDPCNYPQTTEWCEFNPDEIESSDSESNIITAFACSSCGTKSLPQCNMCGGYIHEKELSWEEKFRWETAARIMPLSDDDLYDFKWTVERTDKLIKELKRGRE